MKKVAFFDIDGTVFRSSLVIELVQGLIRHNVFPEDTPHDFEKEYRLWRDREGSYESYIRAIVLSFMKHIRGVHYGDLADVGREVVLEQSGHVYRFTRDLIRELKQNDYYLVAISQSPKTILDSFCAEYGFDKVYGRIYEIGPQDKFTGEMIDVHLIENKANIVRRVIEQESLSLKGSVGVGDTEGDIPILDLVERSICFNPNNTLFLHANKRGWEIVVERKDVIYHIPS